MVTVVTVVLQKRGERVMEGWRRYHPHMRIAETISKPTLLKLARWQSSLPRHPLLVNAINPGPHLLKGRRQSPST